MKNIKAKMILSVIASMLCVQAAAAMMPSSGMSMLSSDRIGRNMQNLERIYRFTQDNFLYDIDHEKVYEAMASAMLAALDDPWTEYITSDFSESYQDTMIGKYGGIGIYLTKTSVSAQDPEDEKTLYVQITGCFPNGPADRAGLKTGDLITEIDGESVVGKTAEECSSAMKGERGTAVRLNVRRRDSEFETSIVREEVIVPTVESQMLDGGVLYLRINSFTTTTASQVKDEMDRHDVPRGLILDLRNNGGGDVDDCLEIADLFLPDNKVIIATTGKVRERNKTYYSTKGAILPQSTEIIALINGGTASASEILALSLKDNGRAKLMGSKSYGKGVMQLMSQYNDGIIKLTTAEYVSGSGTKVNKVGIEPDYPVKEDFDEERDTETIVRLLESGDIAKFVKSNPTFSHANMMKGCAKLKESHDLSDDVLLLLLLNEYRPTIPEKDRKTVYPEYDKVLNEALKMLNGENRTAQAI